MELETIPGSANLAGKLCFLSKTHTSRWIIDSGATHHMCNSLDFFTSIDKILGAKHCITNYDGVKVMVEFYGDFPVDEWYFTQKCAFCARLSIQSDLCRSTLH